MSSRTKVPGILILVIIMILGSCEFLFGPTTTTTTTTTSTTTTTIQPDDLSRGLVAFYPLDGDSNDASGNFHHAYQGHIEYGSNRKGSSGTAAKFDASRSDYLRIPDSADFDFGTGDFTVAFWMYAESNTDAPLVNTYSSSSWGWDIRLDTTLKVFVGGDPNILTDTGVQPALDTWQHVVLRRSSGQVDVFLDGTKTAVGMDANSVDSISTLNVGTFSGYANIFSGRLDDIRLYSRGLRDSEITTLASETGSNPKAVNLDADLQARYEFNYTATYPADSGPNGIHTTSGGAIPFNDRHDTVNGALDFDDQYSLSTDGTDAFDFGTGDFSVSFWFYPREHGEIPLVNQYPEAWDVRLGWSEGVDDSIYVFCGPGDADAGGGSVNTLLRASGTVSLNEWHHVLYRRIDGVLDCFLDGVQWVVGASDEALDSGAALHFSIFLGYPGYTFNGALDDIRVYSRAIHFSELEVLLAE
jgi:hypothetical protein